MTTDYILICGFYPDGFHRFFQLLPWSCFTHTQRILGIHTQPAAPTIEWSTSLISALGEAERNLGRLASLADTLTSPHILVRPFIRREAVLSSRIEGTRASLVDLYQYESAQLTFFEDSSDVREVHNYVRSLDYGLGRSKTLPVSQRLIREMHGILMDGVRGEHLTPGEFRRS